MPYSFEHSVLCRVTRVFAWRFWTCVDNWAVVDASVEYARLNGPFAAGTTGVTKPRDQAEVEWTLVEVQAGRTAAIEIAAPGATLRFEWKFEETAPSATRITQCVTLDGDHAHDYAGAMKELEHGLPSGMRSLAAAMFRAASGAA